MLSDGAFPHQIAVLALDGVFPFELGIPARVFGAAGGAYEVRTCSVDGGPIETNAGFAITPAHGPEIVESAGTVIIAPTHPSRLGPRLSEPVATAMRQIRPGTRVASICTGAFVLAAAGLLDRRRATTHWEAAEQFRTWFPHIRLDEDVLFIEDGDVLTSAGAASGVDLCLHLIRSDLGSEVANRAARRCVVPPFRDGGQAQYIDRPVPDDPASSTAPARQWALEHMAAPLSVPELADLVHMSPRTFARRFRDETGLPPHRWIIQQRLHRARHLLESSTLSVDQIAADVGFATATSLRQHMNAELGVSPHAYRRTFRAEPAAELVG
ncbi:GlxA family transcriptional regulator [Kutzneria buriramensis]|uniref:Transcriptional regulator GlxA family with amidase domain n=1 Tax=Kutzneria buriramensis TaxID=1045776 RepID=A0A3E0HIK6_9PSEU|nr:helix-turn-helix domain-containing protein [Kutzneria buriramensis]REH46324.1 transcriptional regulator GlxA family with amidase domain [Kutzneria buriramensis]